MDFLEEEHPLYGQFCLFFLHFARLTPFLPIASFKSDSFLLQQMDEAFMEDDTIAESLTAQSSLWVLLFYSSCGSRQGTGWEPGRFSKSNIWKMIIE